MILARRDILRQLDDRILLRLLEVDAVDADREVLRLDAVRLARLLQQVDMACIEQVELASFSMPLPVKQPSASYG